MNIIKNIIKTIFAVVMCLTLVFGGVYVNAQEISDITLLGDSITTGFGLSEEELCYGDYLESYFNAEADNFAVDGMTTAELLEKLDEQEVTDSVSEAELVCVSIGGNDFLSIFQDALSEMSDMGNMDFTGEGELNISSDFVSKFMMDYSSAFGEASVQAGENIVKIKDRIKEINPDAEIIMQTVYNPFESSDQELNNIMLPLKTFSALYLTTINNKIKEVSPNTADMYLKFSEKAYLYLNIDNFDIHPNYIGHMLIAEEIIQTLAETGDFSVFFDNVYNIPQGIYSEFPQYTADELDLLTAGQLRRGTLEQTIQRTASAEISQEITETQPSETQQTEESSEATENTSEKNDNKKETSKTNKTLSKILMILGIALILAVTMRRFIRERNKHK